MMYPVEIHVISCTVEPSVPIMCGSATLTIDESMAPISVPKVMETVTSHLFGLTRAARWGRTAASSEVPEAMGRPFYATPRGARSERAPPSDAFHGVAVSRVPRTPILQEWKKRVG